MDWQGFTAVFTLAKLSSKSISRSAEITSEASLYSVAF